MPPHRNVPSNTPSMKPIKPERTLRSHEENQERAYIAASRRSDRSLEARVESARRASDIHKKRTGRALRVTEQDVMNEEMYEEEDDDIPWRYRSVTSHLPMEDGLLSRRIQSMLAVQLENQRLLGQAVNISQQHNPQFQNQAQFVSPGMMQMQIPQNGFQGSMLPPQQFNRTPSSYRQSPYPLPNNQQQMKPTYHQRAATLATPQDVTAMQQQYHHSTQSTPVQSAMLDDRRMSLPHGVPQISQPLQRKSSQTSSKHTTPISSRNGSAPTTPTYRQHPSASPEEKHSHNHPQRPTSRVGSYDPNMNLRRETDRAMAPLTTSLPMESQQLLAGGDGYPMFDMSPQEGMMKPQQPFYSYNPNGHMKSRQGSYGGLNQTLLPTHIDTAINSTPSGTPISASSGPFSSAHPDHAFGMFDGSMFGADMFNAGGSGFSSSQASPGVHETFNEPLFNDFLEQDMFGDFQAATSGYASG
ncbi:hypothetical protein LTR37_014790 [Vermiconidia calcicola]|uniref:Uncharacterized protein n=1 Tax=Vermiconidia calcicola TaxID=1690605 RepID=A0ACC3MTK5_9PEZI|nr:hypothetical protein LTR37_014790 [Vermiconidia calcicola]